MEKFFALFYIQNLRTIFDVPANFDKTKKYPHKNSGQTKLFRLSAFFFVASGNARKFRNKVAERNKLCYNNHIRLDTI